MFFAPENQFEDEMIPRPAVDKCVLVPLYLGNLLECLVYSVNLLDDLHCKRFIGELKVT